MATKLNVKLGLQSVRKPQYASEPDYVQQMRAVSKALQSDLQYILEQFEDVSPEIVIVALTPTKELAQKYTPRRTGELRNSAFLESVGSKGAERVELGFAKGGIPRYATLVHEQVEVPHEAPTRSKFLEAAINEDIGNMIDRLSDGYRRFMGV